LLCGYEGNKGTYPEQETLAADLGTSVDSVARWAAALEARGYVAIKPRYDDRGMRVGLRYELTANKRQLHALADRQNVDTRRSGVSRNPAKTTDTAPVRSPHTAPVRGRDSAPVRREDEQDQELENPCIPAAVETDGPHTTPQPPPHAAGEQAQWWSRAKVCKPRARKERAALQEGALWVGGACAGCSAVIEPQANVIVECANGFRTPGIVVTRNRASVSQPERVWHARCLYNLDPGGGEIAP
jgi:DNA-binding MarR family transcriptional regulator